MASPRRLVHAAAFLILTFSLLPDRVAAQYLYDIRADGVLEWREHLGSLGGTFNWTAVQNAGSGWGSFLSVFPGEEGVIYAIRPDGTLVWYRHDGSHSGSFRWSGPIEIGTSWQGFKSVFYGGDGIIYALQYDGVLVWFRHLGWRTGAPQWEGPLTVGVGWQDYARVFSGDSGAIYAVAADGTLIWFRHLGREDGSFTWDGPQTVGVAWNGFQKVFAAPGGVIYAIQADGTLRWYRHLGYLDGSATWAGPTTVGSGWLFPSVFAAPVPIEGYAWPLSAAPGETIDFSMVSPTDYTVTYVSFQRQGDQNEAVPLTVPEAHPAVLQAVPAQASQSGCGWASKFQLTVPAEWQSGIYAAECADLAGHTFRITFIVKPAPGQHGDFAVLANTNTWNAYNDWGGASKYTNPPANAVSFLRPNPAAAPSDAGGVNHLTRAELWVLDWLATTGYRFDVYTDTDFHDGIDGLAGYKGLIVDTHPEYWTATMLDNLEAYLAVGGNVFYMGGNGLFEAVVLSPDRKSLSLFPAGQYPWRDPSYFRNLVPARPERAILGVAYRYDNYFTFAPLGVQQADHHLFAGTGVINGQEIGAVGLNGGGASGWEMDTSLPGLAPDGIVVSASGSNDRGVAPANLELLARGTNAGGFGADMTYYQTPAGGFVFCAGSISFGGSLVVDPDLQQVVRNALAEAYGAPSAVEGSDPVATGYRLGPNDPNPFGAHTTIRYALGVAGDVRLSVYDLRGYEIARLVDGAQSAGEHTAAWDGRTRAGAPSAAGTYLYRLELGEHQGARVLTGRMTLVR